VRTGGGSGAGVGAGPGEGLGEGVGLGVGVGFDGGTGVWVAGGAADRGVVGAPTGVTEVEGVPEVDDVRCDEVV
jgi:hypothetical protein